MSTEFADAQPVAEEVEAWEGLERAESFFDEFWSARTRVVVGLMLDGTEGEMAVDVLLIVFFGALAVAALGFAVKSFYALTLRMLLVVLSLAVTATSVLFLRFTWEKVNVDARL